MDSNHVDHRTAFVASNAATILSGLIAGAGRAAAEFPNQAVALAEELFEIIQKRDEAAKAALEAA